MSSSAHPLNRQYLISAVRPEALAGWGAVDVGGGLRCFTNNLPVASARCERGSIVGLGEMLDSTEPRNSNHDIVQNLVSAVASGPVAGAFDRLELGLADLGGRWAVVVDFAGETRLYPDCFGTLSSVYYTGYSAGTVVGSQPGLIAEACELGLDSRRADFPRPKGWGWAGASTPYAEIRRLLPNSYLDLRRREVRRFWPGTEAPERVGVQATVELMAPILENLLVSAVTRWDLKIGLTDGYDSRLTLASAVSSGVENASFLTQRRPGMARPGSPVPRLLAAAAGVRWESVPVEITSEIERSSDVMRANSGDTGASRMQHEGAAFGEHVAPAELLILSHCPHGLKASQLDKIPGSGRAEIREWCRPRFKKRFRPAGATAMAELDRWLETLPETSWVDARELYSMEVREGAWLPLKYLALDSVVRVMALANCRSFQTAALAETPDVRMPPHHLLRRLLKHLWPEAPDLPFNGLP